MRIGMIGDIERVVRRRKKRIDREMNKRLEDVIISWESV